MIGRALLVAASLSLIAAMSDCHRAVRTAPTVTTPDSVRGIVSVTGTGFAQALMLRSGTSTIALTANASDSAALARLGGVDVMVFGSRDPNLFRVTAFRAVSVAGEPVVDGVLRADNGNLFLETPSGRVRLGNPPAPLRNLIGARVWVGGSLDKGPNSFGVITRPSER